MENETTTKLRVGRPTISTSIRQQKLKEAEERAAKGETLKKGRPVSPTSKRQQILMEKETIRNSGGEIRVGRPKLAKTEPVKVDVAAEVAVG